MTNVLIKLRKNMSVFLSATLVVSCLSTQVFGAIPSDSENINAKNTEADWAAAAIEKLSQNNIILG
ncbi:MAG: hypothetical protein FWC60_12880, partial [Firmicutes bacterium]|nr:hypothetical protein [Bacillota bacterium]